MINNNICIECDNSKGYYAIENSNINENKECYNDNPIGYYLDNEVFLYKKCYNTCKNAKFQEIIQHIIV